MKILVVGNGFTRYEEPGRYFVNHHTADFLGGLVARGVKVSLAQPVIRVPTDGGLNDARVPTQEIEIIDLNRRAVTIGLKVLQAIWSADLVYLFFPGTWPRLIGFGCLLLNRPFGIYLRGEQFSSKGFDVRLLQRAVAICTETGLEERVRMHSDRIIPVAPMIDMTAQDALARTSERGPNGSLRILFVGRLENAKGVPELVSAARELKERGVSFEMRLVGGGPLYHRLREELLVDSDLPIVLTGLLSDKSSMMAQYEWADALVLPSHHEGFPRVLFEAMIKSCAIVTTMVGGIPAVMRDGVNCLALPVGSSVAIADQLERLAKERGLTGALASAGHTTVLEILAHRVAHIAAVQRIIDAKVR
ncbi:glycosyltransferase family 4 protein [Accumulibacter sp.]|uniref:glycosyltransferase family 4 protein n=1 Tax=Accumulibacter sp. TaxID=2053492 RepID=UPI00262584EC|nr:glycosyltransferase family 4 protein [Accumulibacter sp.]